MDISYIRIYGTSYVFFKKFIYIKMSIIYACEKRYIDNEYVHAEVFEKFGTLIQSFKIFCNEMSHTPSILSTIDISTMSVD